jgi:hypothetical protein
VEVEQGRAVAGAGVEDFADEEGVVAGVDDVVDAALEDGEGGVEDRGSGGSGVPGDAVEALGVGTACELGGEVLLGVAEDADGVVGAGAEVREYAGGVIDGDEDEWRIERNGGERADGKTVRASAAVDRSGDGDAGGPAGAGLAELGGVERRVEGVA